MTEKEKMLAGKIYSAVVKDIPSNSVAVGNPCKVIKRI